MQVTTVTEHILFRPMLPDHADVLFTGNVFVLDNGRVQPQPETQHLSCFTGGMFLLGGQTFAQPTHLAIGEKLARGCAWAYAAFPTGLMPEILGLLACPTLAPCEWNATRWNETRQGDDDLVPQLKPGIEHARDPRYILRPEAIESVFYLYRVTGQEALRDVAWDMFQSIVTATETPLAYSAIWNVRAVGETEKQDSMEVCGCPAVPFRSFGLTS